MAILMGQQIALPVQHHNLVQKVLRNAIKVAMLLTMCLTIQLDVHTVHLVNFLTIPPLQAHRNVKFVPSDIFVHTSMTTFVYSAKTACQTQIGRHAMIVPWVKNIIISLVNTVQRVPSEIIRQTFAKIVRLVCTKPT